MIQDSVQILYVEDDSSDLELTMIALRRNRIANQLHIARDGAEALEFLFCTGAYSGREFLVPKLVLLDMKLPKVDGLDVLRTIRADQRTKTVPVVVLTSSTEQRDLLNSYELRVNSYIQKPVDFEQVQQVVRDLGFYWLIVNKAPLPDNCTPK